MGIRLFWNVEEEVDEKETVSPRAACIPAIVVVDFFRRIGIRERDNGGFFLDIVRRREMGDGDTNFRRLAAWMDIRAEFERDDLWRMDFLSGIASKLEMLVVIVSVYKREDPVMNDERDGEFTGVMSSAVW
jgi:hypothetical protein